MKDGNQELHVPRTPHAAELARRLANLRYLAYYQDPRGKEDHCRRVYDDLARNAKSTDDTIIHQEEKPCGMKCQSRYLIRHILVEQTFAVLGSRQRYTSSQWCYRHRMWAMEEQIDCMDCVLEKPAARSSQTHEPGILDPSRS